MGPKLPSGSTGFGLPRRQPVSKPTQSSSKRLETLRFKDIIVHFPQTEKTLYEFIHVAFVTPCASKKKKSHRRLVPRSHSHAQPKKFSKLRLNSPSARRVAFSSSSLVTCVIIDGEWSIRSVTQKTKGRYCCIFKKKREKVLEVLWL